MVRHTPDRSHFTGCLNRKLVPTLHNPRGPSELRKVMRLLVCVGSLIAGLAFSCEASADSTRQFLRIGNGRIFARRIDHVCSANNVQGLQILANGANQALQNLAPVLGNAGNNAAGNNNVGAGPLTTTSSVTPKPEMQNLLKKLKEELGEGKYVSLNAIKDTNALGDIPIGGNGGNGANGPAGGNTPIGPAAPTPAAPAPTPAAPAATPAAPAATPAAPAATPAAPM